MKCFVIDVFVVVDFDDLKKFDKYSFRICFGLVGWGCVNLFLYVIKFLIFMGKGIENVFFFLFYCILFNDIFD